MGWAARLSKERKVVQEDGSTESIYCTAKELREMASTARRLAALGLSLATKRIIAP
jgi:hypothetical protein